MCRVLCAGTHVLVIPLRSRDAVNRISVLNVDVLARLKRDSVSLTVVAFCQSSEGAFSLVFLPDIGIPCNRHWSSRNCKIHD